MDTAQDPCSAQVGLYRSHDALIGRYDTLIYLPQNGAWEDVQVFLRWFFENSMPVDPIAVPEMLLMTLRSCGARRVDELDPLISWYYRIDLCESCSMSVFKVETEKLAPPAVVGLA